MFLTLLLICLAAFVVGTFFVDFGGGSRFSAIFKTASSGYSPLTANPSSRKRRPDDNYTDILMTSAVVTSTFTDNDCGASHDYGGSCGSNLD